MLMKSLFGVKCLLQNDLALMFKIWHPVAEASEALIVLCLLLFFRRLSELRIG